MPNNSVSPHMSLAPFQLLPQGQRSEWVSQNKSVHKLSLTDFICLFLKRREWKEKEKEKNINVWLPLMLTLLDHNVGMSPDQESNQQPFCLQAGTQSTEPHQPGQFMSSLRRMPGAPETLCLTKPQSSLVCTARSQDFSSHFGTLGWGF